MLVAHCIPLQLVYSLESSLRIAQASAEDKAHRRWLPKLLIVHLRCDNNLLTAIGLALAHTAGFVL